MANRQIEIEDVFDIKGRGIIIALRTKGEPVNLKIGDTIEILRPDRTQLITSVQGIEITCRQCFTESVIPMMSILLDSTVSKADITQGSILQLPSGID